MTYFVIGLMSGSSLDGLDICYTHITFAAGSKWEYKIEHAECVPYPTELKEKLRNAAQLSVPDFLRLDIKFAKFCADSVIKFIQQHDLYFEVSFIASHGHTVWHEPASNLSTQIGDGATIAALTGFKTITNLRNMDVALSGQGAPIVPIADKTLFKEYDFCLNLGGIANVTINGEKPIAFDICPANQVLNHFAAKKGLDFDDEGKLAATGIVNEELFHKMNANEYYQQKAPKSLANSFSVNEIIPLIENESPKDALATSVKHITHQIAIAVAPYCGEKEEYKMLITGGGAFNMYLIENIQNELNHQGLPVQIIIPDKNTIEYKEALAMALIGVLRWREEYNVLASVTGASRDSVGGALWQGA